MCPEDSQRQVPVFSAIDWMNPHARQASELREVHTAAAAPSPHHKGFHLPLESGLRALGELTHVPWSLQVVGRVLMRAHGCMTIRVVSSRLTPPTHSVIGCTAPGMQEVPVLAL